MNLPHEKSTELHDLVGRLCDDSLPDADFERLVSLLSGDLEAQRFYVCYLDMHDSLRRMAVNLEENHTIADIRATLAELERIGEQSTSIADRAAAPPTALPMPDDQSPSPPGTVSDPTLSGPTLLGLSFPAGLGWVMGGMTLLILAAFVWRVGFADRGANLAAGGAATSQERLLEVGSLRLDSGTTRMNLPNVGEMVVDGPAEIEMLSAKRMVLNRGKVRVRVNESGKGFVIETRDGEITDLGTEFGVDVDEDSDTKLVVFDGAVDLRVTDFDGEPTRLVGGEAVTFTRGRDLSRLVAILTGTAPTFRSPSLDADGELNIIVDVSDNLQTADTRRFYEIVPGGMREDALSYVDRPRHEWNGETEKGLPKYLIGADYVKTFSDDEMRTDIEIQVRLGSPAKLYVLMDGRATPPAWLKRDFRKKKERIGMDVGQWSGATVPFDSGVGPAQSMDHSFTIWERVVRQPGVVTLGANSVRKDPYMYGICAVALDADRAEQSKSGSGE